jgi:adenine nucleotide transporter 17
LYKGLKSALIGSVFSYGIYFWWYRFLKNFFSLLLKKAQLSSVEITAVTSLAGSISSIFSNPIWMLNTRLAVQKDKKGVIQVIREIIENEGISAFFKGVFPNLILVLNPIINFVVYEYLKVFAL